MCEWVWALFLSLSPCAVSFELISFDAPVWITDGLGPDLWFKIRFPLLLLLFDRLC